MSSYKHTADGFTLLELLIVLAILGIISFFGMASYTFFLEKNEQQVIMDDLKSAVRFAKIRAVSDGIPVVLSPLDSEWSNGIVLTQKEVNASQEKVIQQWQWPHRYWSLMWSGANPKQIIFASNPTNAMSNGTFTISHVHQQKKKVMVLNRIGRIRVE